MKKFYDKFDNFTRALKRLNEANTAYKSNSENDIYQDALIKRFEFTFELAWKSLREFMTEQGYVANIPSPKGVLSLAYSENFIQNEDIWLNMLEDRNLTSHDYGRDLSSAIADRISNQYCKELILLSKFLLKGI